jgi:hypothetical protein
LSSDISALTKEEVALSGKAWAARHLDAVVEGHALDVISSS